MRTIQKKHLIGIAGIFLLICMGSTRIYGQSWHQSQLINKEWVPQMLEPKKSFYFTISYTTTEEIVALYVNNSRSDTEEVKCLYYLSDEVVNTFQQDAVGKSKSGKYMVFLRKPKMAEERVEIYEILELTDSVLKLKDVQKGTAVECKVK